MSWAVASAAVGWSISPLPLALGAFALACFVRGFRRLRARSPRHAPLWRGLLFVVAVVAAVGVTVSPVHEAGETSLVSAHMLEHLVVADLAPALALVALSGPLALFAVSATVLGAVARRPRLRRGLALAASPVPAAALWAAVLAVWHVPPVYEAAAAQPALHVLEHASFVVAGTLLWIVLLDPARTGRASVLARLAVALVVFTIGQLLATALVLAQDPVYPAYASAPRLLGLSPLEDLDAAGLLMMGEQALTLGVLAAVLVRRHLHEMLDAPAADPLAGLHAVAGREPRT